MKLSMNIDTFECGIIDGVGVKDGVHDHAGQSKRLAGKTEILMLKLHFCFMGSRKVAWQLWHIHGKGRGAFRNC